MRFWVNISFIMLGIFILDTNALARWNAHRHNFKVNNLREKFENGKVPTKSELHLKSTWVCTIYAATYNERLNVIKSRPQYRFSEIKEDPKSVYTDFLLNNQRPTSGYTTFTWDETGNTLSGTDEKGSTAYIRIHHGNLILESTGYRDFRNGDILSLSDQSRRAMTYGYCPQEKVIPPQKNRWAIFRRWLEGDWQQSYMRLD
jgi:hypothetical protein